MAERVLVTGGAGFIGLHLARHLLAEGWDVTLVDDFSRGQEDDEIAAIRSHVELLQRDLTRPLDLPADRYSQVFHLAAQLGVRHAQDHPEQVMRNNLLSTIHLLDWCSGLGGARRLCLASSSEVYAGAVENRLAPVPTPEDVPFVLPDPWLHRTAYAASKIFGEQLAVHHARAHQLQARIVRFHNVYGPRMGSAHVIPQFIGRALRRLDPFRIVGNQIRAFCYISDAVEALARVMALEDPEPLVLNIGNDQEEVRMLELAQELAQIEGYAPRFTLCPAPAGSTERRCPDLGRLRAKTGYRSRTPLGHGLKQTYDWYRWAWQAGAWDPATEADKTDASTLSAPR